MRSVVAQISNSTDLFTAVDDFKPGDKVSLTVIRAQGYSDKPTKLKLQVTLGERPSDTMKR